MQTITFRAEDIDPPATTAPSGPVTFRAEDIDRPPDFTATNEPPSESMWQQVKDFASEAGGQINPIAAVQSAGQALMHPVTAVQQIGAAQGALYDKAKASYEKGDYVSAATHFVNYLLPLIGPGLDAAGEKMRKRQIGAGAGEAVGMGLALFGPEALSTLPVARTAARPVLRAHLTPEEAASVQFGEARGVPIDAATATGNSFVRGIQKVTGESLGGSVVGGRARSAQQEALTRVSGDLASDISPAAATRETAGSGVRGGVTQLVKDLHGQANEAYTQLREIEASPEQSTKAGTAPPQSAEFRRLQKKIAAGAPDGQALTMGEIKQLRGMEAELDAMPFSQRRLQPGRYGGSLEPVEGTGGAGTPLYHEILQEAPGTSDMTRAQVQDGIRKLLEDGEWTNASRGAVALARKGGYRGPSLPADAPMLGSTTRVQMAVNVEPVKTALQPMYEALKREADLVPLQGGKAKALVALDRLMTGPDLAPLSTADAALSDLKSLARSAMPELRTQAQGIAAKAVRELDEAVRARATDAGKAAIDALEQGRAATRAKYQIADVLKQFPKEDVPLYRRLTAAQDTQIGFLRKVQEAAPTELPNVARAYFEDLVARKPDRRFSEWQKLGTETKRILLPQEAMRQNLDHLFLLAKRIAENPNPSGTALTWFKGSELTAWVVQPLLGIPLSGAWTAVAKLLYSPAGVRALTRGLSIAVSPAKYSKAAQAAAVANIVKAAQEAGVTLPVAKAARLDNSQPSQ